ncbi:hypothetical protein CAEBREN_11050 [Caenorhabditis brenneri]|uniref:F-box domain-containing protein n=1 Tax=Caenorhabditis brenneri TaxID=135651 RepID=G0MML3_CAEBE|nr:hypothetical protein CAEBREN_11050 [Caenorhabditis brenneri]
MPLPILRIPVIALKYIVNHMNKIELVKIALCSRRADWLFRRCGQHQLSYFDIYNKLFVNLNSLEHFELSLLEAGRMEGGVCTSQPLYLNISFRDSIEVTVDGFNKYTFNVECLNKLNKFAGTQRSWMMKNRHIPVVMTKNGEMYTFWNNRADGLIFLLKCLIERFRYVTHTLYVHSKIMPDALESLRKFVDYSSLPEVSLIEFRIDFDVQMPIEDFQYILENVKFRDYLVRKCAFASCFDANENFKSNGTIPCSDLSIYSSGHWITLEYLLECKHKEIIVAESKLTNEEIKIYMNQWVAGKIPDIREVHIEMTENFEVEHVLSELQKCRMSDCSQSSDYLHVFVKGAGDKIAMIHKFKTGLFVMNVYSDPDAVVIEDRVKKFNGSENNDENEQEESDRDENTKEKDKTD